MIRRATLTAASAAVALGIFAGAAVAARPADTARPNVVDCGADKNNSVQAAIDFASGPTTIFISGTCVENLSITKDDITLSGNQAGDACNKANPGGTGTIDGTVTVDGVRARIEFLTITGSGDGVDIFNRADVRLTCNDISDNDANGVQVMRSSNAVLRDNTVSGNGTRETDPFIFFDCGLFAADASSVRSDGNTYADNQYCAIEIDRQSSFRNGDFLPRTPGNPADPNGRDVIIERGCDPGTGTGCFTNDFGPLAIEIFNGGLVQLNNADVNGEIEAAGLSSFRVGDDVALQGNIHNEVGSIVRIKDRSTIGDRLVTYTGTLDCSGGAQTFFSNVQCGQTCSGAIPGSCTP